MKLNELIKQHGLLWLDITLQGAFYLWLASKTQSVLIVTLAAFFGLWCYFVGYKSRKKA